MPRTVAPERALYMEGHGKQYSSPPGAPDQTLPISILQLPLQEPLSLVTFWFQPNPTCFPLSSFSLLKNSCQGFPFESHFAYRYILCDTLAHSIGCSQSGCPLQTALGFSDKTHWHS